MLFNNIKQSTCNLKLPNACFGQPSRLLHWRTSNGHLAQDSSMLAVINGSQCSTALFRWISMGTSTILHNFVDSDKLGWTLSASKRAWWEGLKWQNSQDHTPSIQFLFFSFFFWGRRSAAGSCDTDAQCWETLKPQRKVNSQQYIVEISAGFQKMSTFQKR